MVRVAMISDTHIGKDRSLFLRNWEPLRAWLEAQSPTLVIHGGDVTLDGADLEGDFDLCTELLRSLPAPCLLIAGNHDVGIPGASARQPVNSERLARWKRHFGADRWTHDIEGWRLIGFNSMVLGSNLPEEEEQFAWLDEVMASAGGRRIAWFCHQPLFIHGYEDGAIGYWSVPPLPRHRLEALAQRFDVGLVATGHLHKSREMTIGDTKFVWCPSTSFTVGPSQPEFPGEKFLGAVVLDFELDTVSITTVPLPVLTPAWIEDVVQQVYPR